MFFVCVARAHEIEGAPAANRRFACGVDEVLIVC